MKVSPGAKRSAIFRSMSVLGLGSNKEGMLKKVGLLSAVYVETIDVPLDLSELLRST